MDDADSEAFLLGSSYCTCTCSSSRLVSVCGHVGGESRWRTPAEGAHLLRLTLGIASRRCPSHKSLQSKHFFALWCHRKPTMVEAAQAAGQYCVAHASSSQSRGTQDLETTAWAFAIATLFHFGLVFAASRLNSPQHPAPSTQHPASRPSGAYPKQK